MSYSEKEPLLKKTKEEEVSSEFQRLYDIYNNYKKICITICISE